MKVVLTVVAIFIAYHLYKGLSFGDLKSYFIKSAVETVIDETNLSSTQKEYLEAGDFESLAKDLEQNVTPEQINCAVEAVGKERADELMVKQDPTPEEILKLSKCL